VEIHDFQQWILVKIIHLPSNNFFHLFNVYIPNNYNEKLECLNSLTGIQDLNYGVNNIIVGDFNTTLHQKEKRVGSMKMDPCRENMEHIISSLDLIDIQPL